MLRSVQLTFPPEARSDFARNTFLVYSGIKRDAGASLGTTLSQLLSGDQAAFDRLTAFRLHAEQMTDMLEEGRVISFAKSLPRLMKLKAVAHPASSIPKVKK